MVQAGGLIQPADLLPIYDIALVRETAGRAEQYWCPIRHAKRIRNPHAHYHEFVEFGDARATTSGCRCCEPS